MSSGDLPSSSGETAACAKEACQRAHRGNGWDVAVIIVWGCVVLLPGTATLPLVDRDEPRFARAAVEMREAGEVLLPTFNGEPRYDKPPGIYALIRGGMAVAGDAELGVRLHAVVSALVTGLLIYGMGRDLRGRQTGVLAALGWLTCLQVAIHGRLCLADMAMVAVVTAAQWSLWRHLDPVRPAPGPGGWLALYGALALGFAIKGPIAWLVPAGTVLLWRWSSGRPVPWARLRWVSGCGLVLVLTASWGVPALLRSGGMFWDVGVGRHVVDRGLEAFNGRWPLPVYYLLTIWISLFPWSGYLPAVVREVWRQRADSQTLFLAAWAATPILMFSFYATQLPHYILPGFPALFLLGAVVYQNGHRGHPGLMLAIGVVAVLGLAALCQLGPPLPMAYYVVVAGLAAGLMAYALVPAWAAWRHPSIAATALILYAACALVVPGTLRTWSPTLEIGELVRQQPTMPSPRSIGFDEPGLVFYSQQIWLKGAPPAGQEGWVVRLVRERSLVPPWKVRVQGTAEDATPAPGFRLQGFNWGRMSWVELVLHPAPPTANRPESSR